MTLDEATDQLYGADLDSFVAERTRLARELRDAGDRELVEVRTPALSEQALARTLDRVVRDEQRARDRDDAQRDRDEFLVAGRDNPIQLQVEVVHAKPMPTGDWYLGCELAQELNEADLQDLLKPVSQCQ